MHPIIGIDNDGDTCILDMYGELHYGAYRAAYFNRLGEVINLSMDPAEYIEECVSESNLLSADQTREVLKAINMLVKKMVEENNSA